MNVCFLLVTFASSFCLCVKSQGGGLSLIYENEHSLKKWDQETQERTDIVDNLKYSVAIDYHYNKSLVFWSDGNYHIYSFTLGSNGSITPIIDVRASGLAVDWIHDNLYWTDSGSNSIGVARLDGSLVKKLFDRNIIYPTDIVIDPVEGLLFWIDKWFSISKIERSGTDGSHRTVIFTDTSMGFTLVIDYISHAIYWKNYEGRKIFTCSYSGTNLRVIFSTEKHVGYIEGIDILGDWLYVNVWSSPKSSIYKVDKHGVRNMTRISDGKNGININTFKVYDSSKQIPGVNRCVNNGGCSYLCVPAPREFVKGELKHTCVDEDYVIPTEELLAIGNDYFPPDIIIGSLIGLVILTCIAFYLYKHFATRPKHKVMKSEEGKRNHNPIYYVRVLKDEVPLKKAPTVLG